MIELGTTENFKAFLDTLCLTDRQKQIAYLKYLRGWVGADIAEEVGICRRTYTKEIKIIREIIGKAEI